MNLCEGIEEFSRHIIDYSLPFGIQENKLDRHKGCKNVGSIRMDSFIDIRDWYSRNLWWAIKPNDREIFASPKSDK